MKKIILSVLCITLSSVALSSELDNWFDDIKGGNGHVTFTNMLEMPPSREYPMGYTLRARQDYSCKNQTMAPLWVEVYDKHTRRILDVSFMIKDLRKYSPIDNNYYENTAKYIEPYCY